MSSCRQQASPPPLERRGVADPEADLRAARRRARSGRDLVDDRALIVAEGDLRLGNGGVAAAPRGRQKLDQGLPLCGVLPRHARFRLLARVGDRLCDRPALGLVGVEQRRRRRAGHHQRELPAEIVGVLDAGVHAMGLDRAAGMGGIACEQDATDPIAARHAGVGVEELRLIGVLQRRARRGRREPRAHGRQDVIFFGVRPEIDPPATFGQRDRVQHWRIELHGRVVARVRPAREVRVDHAPWRRVVVTVELITDRLAHGAVEAIGAEHPARLQRSLGLVERTEPRPDATLPLLEADELDAALHLSAELLEPFGQNALGLMLGDAEHEGERAVDTFEPEGRGLGVARENVDAADDMSAPHEGVRQTHAGEHFERAGFQQGRPIPAERLRVPVDQMEGHAAPRELEREHQPGRTGADDQNGVV